MKSVELTVLFYLKIIDTTASKGAMSAPVGYDNPWGWGCQPQGGPGRLSVPGAGGCQPQGAVSPCG